MATKERTAGARLEPTLPARYYCDPAILERELERIFARSWVCAGRADRIAEPGDYFTLGIGAEELLITRAAEGRVRAFHNVCRHRGSRLCEAERGHLQGSIQCPYHAWTYSLDGKLIGTPGMKEGVEICREEFSLHAAALETWGGFLFLRVEPAGPPLSDQLGDLGERFRRYPLGSLKSAVRLVHEVEANWKILVENYQECYHCPGVHPELCDIVPLYRTGEVDGRGGEIAWFREGASTFTHGGKTRRPFLTGLNEDEKRRFDGDLVLPNMFLNLFPDYVHTRTLWPLGPGRTRIISEWLFEPSTMARPDFDPSDAVEFLNLVGWQDWKICEGVQKGMASRVFKQGVYTPQERYAARIKRWVLEKLGGEPAL